MDREQIKVEIIKLVAEQLGKPPDKISEDSKFLEDLGADSLDNVELILALEQMYDLEIPDEKSMEITTIGQAIDHVIEHIKSKH